MGHSGRLLQGYLLRLSLANPGVRRQTLGSFLGVRPESPGWERSERWSQQAVKVRWHEDVGRFPDPEQSRPVKGPGSPGLRTEPPRSRTLAAGTQGVCPADSRSACAVLCALGEAGAGPPHLPLWLASFKSQVPVGLGKPFGQSRPNPGVLEGWPGLACRKWQILLTRSRALGWQAGGKRPVR